MKSRESLHRSQPTGRSNESGKPSVHALVPVKRFENSKSRLRDILAPSQRIELCSCMLHQTLDVLSKTPAIGTIIIISSEPRAYEISKSYGRCKVLPQAADSGVNSAVTLGDELCISDGTDGNIVVPIDLPFISPRDLEVVLEAGRRRERSVVICPSERLDGTNILFRRPTGIIGTQYDNDSYRAHIASAQKLGIEPTVISSPALGQDIDTIEDIRAVFLKRSADNPVLAYLRSILQVEQSPPASPRQDGP